MKFSTRYLFIIGLVVFSLINGCAAVRMVGKMASASGNVMVNSADEEEAKKKGSIASKDSKADASNGILTIKKSYTSVKVRAEPSTKRPSITTLTGGDKVEKISEKQGWVNIYYNVDGNQGNGWIKSDYIESKPVTR